MDGIKLGRFAVLTRSVFFNIDDRLLAVILRIWRFEFYSRLSF